MTSKLPPITDVCPTVYWSYRNGIMTTGSYITPTDDRNIMEQLHPEICKFEGEKEIQIVEQVTHWTVHVRGQFAPIGKIYVLAMLDPEYKT